MQISVYVENLNIEDKLKVRAKVIKGLPDWFSIIQDEVSGRYIKRVQDEAKAREDMVVTSRFLARYLMRYFKFTDQY